MTKDDTLWGDYCRLLAKIIINIQRAQWKESPDYELVCLVVSKVGCSDLGEFAEACIRKNYSWEYIKTICQHHFDTNTYYYFCSFMELVELFPYQTVDDAGELESICLKVMSEQPQAVSDYKKGKLNSINRLKGQVMKATAGKANAKVVDETLTRLLK